MSSKIIFIIIIISIFISFFIKIYSKYRFKCQKVAPKSPPPNIIEQIQNSIQKSNQELWQSEIESLLLKYKLFEPECGNFDDCKKTIINKYFDFSIQIYDKKHFLNKKDINDDKCKELLKLFSQELLLLKNEKIEEYNIKYNGQKKLTDYYKPIKERTSKTSSYPEPSQTLKEKPKIDNKVLRDYHLKILESAKEYLEENKAKQQEYEETKKQIKEQLHSLVEMPSRFIGRLMSSSKKQELVDIKLKINIWSDKIIELISDFTAWKSERCKNLDECIEKITTIIDIINSFVERPNTMINQELPKINKYNIQKNKIYKLFLNHYKITFTDIELENPEYIKLRDEYKQILIVLQNMKLDDCKKTGGKKHKKPKSNKI